MEILLEHGADLSHRKHGLSALHLAAKGGYVPILKVGSHLK